MKAREEKQRDIRSTKYSVQRETNKEIRKKIIKTKKKKVNKEAIQCMPPGGGGKKKK